MGVNTKPIFSVAGNLSNNNSTGMNQLITAAANDYTGAGANNSLVFTAGSNGSLLTALRLKAGGTNVASVMRFYLNNGSAPTTATNNEFFDELSLPATTATATAATVTLELAVNKVLPAGWRVYAGLGTAVAAGWVVVPWGTNY